MQVIVPKTGILVRVDILKRYLKCRGSFLSFELEIYCFLFWLQILQITREKESHMYCKIKCFVSILGYGEDDIVEVEYVLNLYRIGLCYYGSVGMQLFKFYQQNDDQRYCNLVQM
eukprot:TRINITY_DN3133_c0_g1_i14.p3 TRINITY_DN3133_c0_g1~~TRINITY_DN3133_c0_g1_i14.p3  ORF type:complete len:115 (-),score=3.88 TRINITY_DN3133_c0_g1_i14:84-428(-)